MVAQGTYTLKQTWEHWPIHKNSNIHFLAHINSHIRRHAHSAQRSTHINTQAHAYIYPHRKTRAYTHIQPFILRTIRISDINTQPQTAHRYNYAHTDRKNTYKYTRMRPKTLVILCNSIVLQKKTLFQDEEYFTNC